MSLPSYAWVARPSSPARALVRHQASRDESARSAKPRARGASLTFQVKPLGREVDVVSSSPARLGSRRKRPNASGGNADEGCRERDRRRQRQVGLGQRSSRRRAKSLRRGGSDGGASKDAMTPRRGPGLPKLDVRIATPPQRFPWRDSRGIVSRSLRQGDYGDRVSSRSRGCDAELLGAGVKTR
jgi:hypothetical protein